VSQSTGGVTDQDRYREYWAYLRHIESLRFQVATVVSVAVGGALGVVLSKRNTAGRLDAWALAVVLGLELFILLAGLYLVGHKNNYSWYFRQVRELDPESLACKPRFEVFGWLLGMLALVQAALALTAGVLGDSLPWRAGAVAAAVLGIGCWWLSYRSGRMAAFGKERNGRVRSVSTRCQHDPEKRPETTHSGD
jgi:hypothetical protein